ncbi:MAG: hypothetical protein R3C61_17255 [Bacteroidia bacterium]
MRVFSQDSEIPQLPRPTMREDSAGILFALILYVAVIFGIRFYNPSTTVSAQETVQTEATAADIAGQFTNYARY